MRGWSVYLVEPEAGQFSVRLAADDFRFHFPTMEAAVDAARDAALTRFRLYGAASSIRIRGDDGHWVEDVAFGRSDVEERLPSK